MLPFVAATWVYPVKGMHGIATPNIGLQVEWQLGVKYDRFCAVHRRPGTRYEGWKPKGQFHVCMNRDGMALDHGLQEHDLSALAAGYPASVESLVDYYLLPREQSSLWIADYGSHLCDRDKPYVSFLNLASVRALSEMVGRTIDPRRFRMNVWVDGMEPFAEITYITKRHVPEQYPMIVGALSLGIDDVCERCRAIEQDPETGEWDDSLQAELGACMQEVGYDHEAMETKPVVMGWYGLPQADATIRVGDQVRFGS